MSTAPSLATLWARNEPVHVWHFRLDVAATLHEDDVRPLLGEEEIRRARAMQSRGERQLFMAAHAGVRTILAGYMGMAPEAIGFRYGAFGKPHLCGPAAMLAFNAAYAVGPAHTLAAVAVSCRRDVGLAMDLAHNAKLSKIERWAWLKANGQGFASSVAAEHFPMPDWFRRTIEIAPGVVAAVVASGQEGPVELFAWDLSQLPSRTAAPPRRAVAVARAAGSLAA